MLEKSVRPFSIGLAKCLSSLLPFTQTLSGSLTSIRSTQTSRRFSSSQHPKGNQYAKYLSAVAEYHELSTARRSNQLFDERKRSIRSDAMRVTLQPNRRLGCRAVFSLVI